MGDHFSDHRTPFVPAGDFLGKHKALATWQFTQWKAGVIGALNFAALVLAARLIVLVAVTGGILLTWTALVDPQLYRLLSLVAYGSFVVLPVVWLSSVGRG